MKRKAFWKKNTFFAYVVIIISGKCLTLQQNHNQNPKLSNYYENCIGDKLQHTAKARTLKACRAYFQFLQADNNALQFVLNFGSDMTTDIVDIEHPISNNEQDTGTWYTLDGVKHDKRPIKKGLYIKNGKKIVIK